MIEIDLKRLLKKQVVGERIFLSLSFLALIVVLSSLIVLIIDVIADGHSRLSLQFLTGFPSRKPEEAGILVPLVGSIYMIILTGLFALPLGIGAAIYLEAYAPKNWFSSLVELNIANLAAVPSIIYGLLGLELFVRMMGLGRSLIAGALTMALLLQPVIIIVSREAIRSIPISIWEASFALGATRWQTIRHQILPLAMPGIMTGAILSFSRAIGETAPLITMGALTYIAFLPDGIFSPFTVLPIQIFNWVSRPQKGFMVNAAAGIIILLIILILLNSLAVWLRNKFQRRLNW
ncbi:MAG: phosphate ABC transporter permease PstA [Nitrospirae bacterium]|nr:phosphate ABC transporter permease PstA [Nitrospirota bacterium]